MGAVYGLCMTCANFTTLPNKHNGQAELNSTMEVKHSIFYVSEPNKGKSLLLILHVLSQNICYILQCVLQYHQKLPLWIVYFSLQCIFHVLLVIIGYIGSTKTGICKSLCKSLEKTYLITVINSFTPDYGFTAQDLAVEVYQKLSLFDQKCEFYEATPTHWKYVTTILASPANILQHF